MIVYNQPKNLTICWTAIRRIMKMIQFRADPLYHLFSLGFIVLVSWSCVSLIIESILPQLEASA